MRRYLAFLLAPVMLFAILESTGQAGIILRANLTNDQEISPVIPTTALGVPRPVSFGTATFFLNDAMTALTFTATIFNIDVTGSQTLDMNDNLFAAHIHAPADPGSNAGVVWGFFGNPFNDTNPTDTVVTPFATGVGGTFSGKWDSLEGNNTTLITQIPNILAGKSYLNFHTIQFPGGEIRGQIAPVPEPSTMALLCLGGMGLVGSKVRKRRKIVA